MTETFGTAAPGGVLGDILERKCREVARRIRHASSESSVASDSAADAAAAPGRSPSARMAETFARLRRGHGSMPHVIAEVKFRSPSAGEIRPWRRGEAVRVAGAYERGGASAISVLADHPGFGGSPLTVRRVAAAAGVPVLFKEFVLHEVQLELARRCGASLVLLLVRALEPSTLARLVRSAEDLGLLPVVEAADADEMQRALDTGAALVGVNARDLRTFHVDPALARRCLEVVPDDRVAVFMSGVKTRSDLEAVAEGRADAVLVGEGLMRTDDPEATLRRWLDPDISATPAAC